MGPLTLAADRLGFRYRRRARGDAPFAGVRDVTLHVRAGSVIGVLGPNGAGKSTLLRLAATALRPDTGTLEILGHDARRPSGRLRRCIGYAGDDDAHVEALGVRDNALFFARATGLDRARAAREVAMLLERLGLAPFARVRAGECSHGTRRKLLLTAALAHHPALLVLDEPTTGLDPDAEAALLALLRERARHGAAVLLATHDVRAAHRICDHVIFLDDGRVVLAGEPQALLASAGRGTRIRVRFRGTRQPVLRIDGVDVLRVEHGTAEVRAATGSTVLPTICAELIAQAVDIASIEVREPDLRDVFRAVTGHRWGQENAGPA